MSDRSGYSGSESEGDRSYYDHSDERDGSGSESDEEQSDGVRDDDVLEPGEVIEPTSIVDYNHL